jgi:hypothetical protein
MQLTSQIEQTELVFEHAHIPRFAFCHQIKPLHAGKCDPKVAPDMGRIRIQVECLQEKRWNQLYFILKKKKSHWKCALPEDNSERPPDTFQDSRG